MQYPNRIQACLVFDERIDALEAIVRDFAKIEEMKTGTTFNVPESNPGLFYRLYGGDELMLTFEYIEGPANPDAFRGPLSSTVTGMLCPDIRERLSRSKSHILVEASHGALGGVEEDPKIAAMFEQIGRRRSGASQSEFERRLDVLALMSRIVTDHAMPSAVHWTQSDQLIAGENFDGFAAAEAPGPLHIHPYLFGPKTQALDEHQSIGIRTFGARHWLGREVLIEPSILPWAANYETILAFLRIATTENGYVIPDGDTFGPEDRSQSYRVTWHEAGETDGDLSAEEGGVPLYKLTPLKHTEYDFLADEHVPDENVIDDQSFPAVLMPADQEAKMEEANRWRESRKLAEGIGATFEVRARGTGGEAPPEPPAPAPTQISAPTPSNPGLPSVSGRRLRAKVFGRKQA